jgi:Na+/proline symporter/signal transduction histidine kinase
MLQGWVIALVSFAYLGILFAIAFQGDRRADAGRSVIANPLIYSLSLGVYCTTWTYYGSVGRAAASGVGFLPIYLGPTLLMALWWFLMRKMIRIAKDNRITSIADFIASRYGKSQLLGGLVTIIAVVGVVPYIALQLKAVSNSFTMLVHYPDISMSTRADALPLLQDSTLYVALILAAFTILFGTRHLDATERHEGMVAAIAFESVVKLVAFLAVGLFVTYGMHDGLGELFSEARARPATAVLLGGTGSMDYGSWASLTFLAMSAILFLPRQFQIAVVENVDENHLRRAIWMFPLYLLLINLFVMPIALAGLLQFSGGGVDTDTFVLALPMAHQQEGLALLVFIGGLSAATGMVIVETIALSTMLCNDLVMPLLLRWGGAGLARREDLSGLLLDIRRWAIVLILLLGYIYFRVAGEAYALVGIGLISFAAVAQFAPAVIGALYWKAGTRLGALAGLSAGFLVWGYTLLLPSFAKSGWLSADFMQNGFLGSALFRPQQLFGLTGLDEISHCLFWSMLANIGAYLAGSLWRSPNAREARQANLFVDALRGSQALGESGRGAGAWRGSARVGDLLPLLGRFLGPDRARDAFDRYAASRGVAAIEAGEADAGLVHFAESQLTGAIGSASARVMVSSVVQEEPLSLDEVMNILDEASQVRAYSRQLEQKSTELEAATAELRAANERLKDLDRLKDDFMSTVSHELRTPLTSIRAFSEMLLEDPKTELAERKHFLNVIVAETERLTRLINQILDMAKIESGRGEWHSERLDLVDAIRHSIDATMQLYRAKGVSIELHVPPDLPPVLADRDRLIQVIINLLSNAVKFSPVPNGRVEVGVRVSGDFIEVAVADNGGGVAASDQQLIFEKFRQGGNALTDKPQGTGLGLPISRQIIEHFGGRLWVDSQPETGRPGATFLFTLPLDAGIRETMAAGGREKNDQENIDRR